MKLRKLTAALAGAAVIGLAICGCSNQSDGITPQQQQSVDSTNAIFNKTTDWNKLSQADKDTLTQTIGGGNESFAQSVFEHRPAAPGSHPQPQHKAAPATQ